MSINNVFDKQYKGENKMKYTVGIDLGGTFIKSGLVSDDGQLLYESILPSEADTNAGQVIDNIILAVKKVQQSAEANGIVPVGIGVGTPGIVDKAYRIVIGAAENIVGWTNVPLADRIEEACELPVWINNDANMMGLGEQAFGAARGCSDVLFLTVGTGIGGAIIINDKLFGGYDNRGTELGHIPLFADGVACSCGSVGCLEAYASTTALVMQFEKKCQKLGIIFNEKISGKLIIKLFHENHPLAIESVNEHCRYLGQGIAGLVNVFSPQRVVIGGGISEAGDFYIAKIKNSFQRYVMPDCAVNTEICAAQLGNRAGVLGAAQWALVNGQ